MDSRTATLRCTTFGVAGRLLAGLAGLAVYFTYLGA